MLAATLSIFAVAPASAGSREEGYSLYRNGSYGQALKKFLKAYRQSKNPDLLYNVAKCHEKLGQYEPAIRFFKEYLTKVPSASDRQDVEKIIAALTYRLEATYPDVEFVSSPAGANVQVDGAFAGQAPFKMQVKPGKHTARFELDGYDSGERAFDVQAGKKMRLAMLMRRAGGGGSLKLLCNVNGARILIDGQLIGATPQKTAKGVSLGVHRVRVEKEGYAPWQQEVKVTESRERVVFASLKASGGGWSKKAIIGSILLGLAAGSEGFAWFFYAKANNHYKGTDDFEQNRDLNTGLHIGAGVLAAAGAALLTWALLEPAPELPVEQPDPRKVSFVIGLNGVGVHW